MSYFLLGRALKPLRRLSGEIGQITENELSQHIDGISSQDEIGSLADSFNRMLERLDKSFSEQKRFSSDAAHELKTPLTVIMTNAEMLQSDAFDEEKRGKFLGSILTMSGQMRKLIEQMLELARADDAETEEVFGTIHLSQLVTQAVLPFEAVFFEKGLDLSMQIEDNISVKGGEEPLRQVLEILLDNAQKYAKPQGSVWVELRRKGKNRCVLTLSLIHI